MAVGICQVSSNSAVLAAQSYLTLCNPTDCSLSMGFPRQEYWSGLPFPSPGNLPDPGIEPRSPAVIDRRFIVYSLSTPHSWLMALLPTFPRKR